MTQRTPKAMGTVIDVPEGATIVRPDGTAITARGGAYALDALGVDIAQRSLVGEASDVGNDLLVAHLGEPGRAAHLERG